MRGNLRIIIACAITACVSVAASVIIFLEFYYRPIVVIDLKDLVSYQKAKIKDKVTNLNDKKEVDTAVREIGTYFDWLGKEIMKRDEIVLVKEAVVNSGKVKDVTSEYKK